MADYKLWNALKNAKKYRWVELSHSLNNESPYWSGIPEGSVELAKTVWDWGKPELECLIQTFKFPGQFGTHIDFPGHFIKGKALSEKYDVNDLIFPLVVIDISEQAKKDPRYAVTVEDIKAYEAKYGPIPDGALVALRNIGVLITDHNVQETLCITDRAYLLFEGQILFEGTPQELAVNPVVLDKYLTRSFELRMKDFKKMEEERARE